MIIHHCLLTVFHDQPSIDISTLVNKILNIIMPILMVISIGLATIYTAITFISGFNDVNAEERKQKIKRLVWIWICAGGVFLTSTIILVLKQYFEKLIIHA